MPTAVVDRFEGQLAVLILQGESRPINVPRKDLPRGTAEGDHLQLTIEAGQVVRIERDESATQDARERIQGKMDRLRKNEHLKDAKSDD